MSDWVREARLSGAVTQNESVSEGRNNGLRPSSSGLAGLGDVPRLRTLRTIDDFELNLLAFFERPESVALDCREVHEDIIAALALDEAITFSVVEPLDLARNTHRTCLPCENRRGYPRLTKKRPHLRSSCRRWSRPTSIGNAMRVPETSQAVTRKAFVSCVPC